VRIKLTHQTRLDYTQEVTDGVMDVRLGPLSDDHQRWVAFQLRAVPNAAVETYRDGFGNAANLITVRRPHQFVEVESRGEIETLLSDPFALPTRPPRALNAVERVDYLSPSPLVPADPRLLDAAWQFASLEPFEAVQQLMHTVHAQLGYEQQVTDVTSDVGAVLDARRGVCQDFAHVLIGMCRAIDIPARYVSGYIVGGRGENASHAWVEAFTPSHGWRGFDPTNDLVASEHHVKMALGRDYGDVPPTRGAYHGIADERLTVTVGIRETPAEGRL
jgi:transglutaminase-like putative cysteine protease